MKRIAMILVAFGLVAGTAAAVVGHNDTGNGDVSITSTGPDMAATGVNENGTDYTVSVDVTNLSQNQTENQVSNVTHSESMVEFSGVIQAPTPCHVLEADVNESSNSYTLDIQTVREDSDQACAEVVTGIEYDAEFEADPGFELEVQHDGEAMETITHETQEEPGEQEEMSLIERILAFFGL